MTINNDQVNWESSGLSEPEGRGLYRPLSGSTVLVPTCVELRNEGLEWKYSSTSPTKRPTGKGMLEGFVNLSRGSDKAICEYAQKWGVLEICKHHGLPRSHNSNTWPRVWSPPPHPLFSDDAVCVPLSLRHVDDDSCESGWEALERWRYFSSQAKAVLNIAASLNQGHPGSAIDWEVLDLAYHDEWEWKEYRQTSKFSVKHGHSLLSFVVNDWLQLGGVRPQFLWTVGSKPRIEWGGPTLFGHLAVQMALVVSQTNEMAFCSHCGIPYLARRQPNPNRRHYCETCRKAGIAERLASRDYRRRAGKVKAKRR